MLFTAKIRLFIYIILKFSSLRFFSKKAEKSGSTGASGATGAKRTVKAAYKSCLQKDLVPPQAAKFILSYNHACSALASIAAASSSVIYSGLMSRPI